MARYKLTRQDSVNYAKRCLVDTIWKEAKLEGIGVTFPDTQEIFEGRTVSGLSVDDTVAINNLKHAWQFLLSNLDRPVDGDFIKSVNRKVGEGGIVSYAGDLRTGVVGVGGTEWIPEVPSEGTLESLVSAIASEDDAEDRGLKAFALIAKAQLFNDGNKRTAQLVANQILIGNGCGIFVVPVAEKREFMFRLIDYYETDDLQGFVDYLRDTCISGYNSPIAGRQP